MLGEELQPAGRTCRAPGSREGTKVESTSRVEVRDMGMIDSDRICLPCREAWVKVLLVFVLHFPFINQTLRRGHCWIPGRLVDLIDDTVGEMKA